ncbi:hypothetical protein [Kribbia dieselivorans]|uniref:hypothetical protein n=1 Tax=Kribbia dieselivorans TaxID=331526 RepID=UPI000837F678|nr:hypothetical protein [Kribbia dieselivorans]
MSRRTTTLSALSAVALAVGGALAVATPSATAAPAAGAAATSTTAARCSTSGKTFRKVNTLNVPSRAVHTARRLQTDAKDCDKRALVWRATKDRTHLSYGFQTPAQAFAIPDRQERRYWYLAKALTIKPGTSKTEFATYKVWPRVATRLHANKDAAWQELVTSGMYSQREVNAMRRSGIGYTGWRVGVSAGGRWVFDIAGD